MQHDRHGLNLRVNCIALFAFRNENQETVLTTLRWIRLRSFEWFRLHFLKLLAIRDPLIC